MNRLFFDNSLIFLLVPLLWLVALAVLTFCAYLAIRFGVRHGIRDGYRSLTPPPPPGEVPGDRR